MIETVLANPGLILLGWIERFPSGVLCGLLLLAFLGFYSLRSRSLPLTTFLLSQGLWIWASHHPRLSFAFALPACGLFVLFLLGTRARLETSANPLSPPIRGGLLVLIATLAISLRLWHLDLFPKAREPEFTIAAAYGLEVLETGKLWIVKMLTGNGQPFLCFTDTSHPYLLFVDVWAFLFQAFGASVGVARIFPAFLGLLGLIALFLLTKAWFQERTAFAACFLMAISPYMLSLSRNTWAQIILLIPFTLVALLCLWNLLQKPSLGRFALVGFLIALGGYLYRPAVIVSLIVGITLALRLARDAAFRKSHGKSALLAAALTALFLLPLAVHIASSEFLDRFTMYAGSGRSPGILHFVSRNFPQVLEKILGYGTFEFYEGLGTHGGNRGKPGMLHLPITVSFFAFGLGAAVSQSFVKLPYALLVATLLGGLAPFLPTEEMFPRRLIVSESVYFLFAGLGLQLFLQPIGTLSKVRKRIATVLLGIFAYGIAACATAVFLRENLRHPPLSVDEESRIVAAAIRNGDQVAILFENYTLGPRILLDSWPLLPPSQFEERVSTWNLSQDTFLIPPRAPGARPLTLLWRSKFDSERRRFLRFTESKTKGHLEIFPYESPEFQDLSLYLFRPPVSSPEEFQESIQKVLSIFRPQ